jgi:alkanesulfonate monooxygenase SsuD/methylene tetrahydromethanopterin reductase-like flavin-dependent oxidoreductase (luciferase family)
LATERVKRRLAAILAADVAGYSRLIGADEESPLAALKAIRRDLVDPKFAELRGRIVKTTGDGLLVEFASVVGQACWAPGGVSFTGKFFSFADMHVSPKPLQQPHPPIWIGGASDAALRRAARFAAVWQPTPLPLAQLIERRAALRQACEAIGRAIPTRMSFRVEFSTITGNAPAAGKERPTGHGTPAEVSADMLRYREAAGLDAFQINFHGNRDVDQLLQSMECFMREVKSRLA